MANKSSLIYLLLSSFFLALFFPSPIAAAPVARAPERVSFDTIYQFGDSLSDTGNLVRDSLAGAQNPCGHLPYGETSLKNSGRCSNGLLMVDYFAKFFHLPLLSPYLDKEGNFTSNGVNFAVAGSTALATDQLAAMGIISPVTNSSLSVQLEWFKSHLQSICGDNASACKQKVRNSLIIMGEIGGNDYNYALLQGRTPQDLMSGMVPAVIEEISQAVREVINLGAIRVVVPGNFPIGCMPIYLSLFEQKDPKAYDRLHCLKSLNNFAIYHNHHLQQAINELQEEYPDVAIVYGDYFSGLRNILSNAASLGFDQRNLQKACCGVDDGRYNFDMKNICGMEGVPVCQNPDERFSWDGIHLTQHAYLHMAQELLQSIVPGILHVV